MNKKVLAGLSVFISAFSLITAGVSKTDARTLNFTCISKEKTVWNDNVYSDAFVFSVNESSNEVVFRRGAKFGDSIFFVNEEKTMPLKSYNLSGNKISFSWEEKKGVVKDDLTHIIPALSSETFFKLTLPYRPDPKKFKLLSKHILSDEWSDYVYYNRNEDLIKKIRSIPASSISHTVDMELEGKRTLRYSISDFSPEIELGNLIINEEKRLRSQTYMYWDWDKEKASQAFVNHDLNDIVPNPDITTVNVECMSKE